MQNFVFHNPTKILFGQNTLQAAGKEAVQFGDTLLLVTGQNSASNNGVLDVVKGSIIKEDIRITEFRGITPNPDLVQISEAISLVKKKKIGSICAVGGGSVIDAAKAIAAGALVEHDVWKFFLGKKSVTASLPLMAISTLAASGSEMNSGMVLSNRKTEQKLGYGHRLLFPKVAILDPETTFTVPKNYTVFGSIDVMAHLMEYYFTTKALCTDIQDSYIEGLAKNIVIHTDRVVQAPEDYQSRAALMWAAGLALNGLSSAGLGRVGFPMHLLAHSISAKHDTPHGAALGAIMPGWLHYHLDVKESRLIKFFDALFSNKERRISSAREGLEQLVGWVKSMGGPICLEDLGINKSEIKHLAENTQDQAKIWRMGKDYPVEKVREILRYCSDPTL